jgi:hypothetical protein
VCGEDPVKCLAIFDVHFDETEAGGFQHRFQPVMLDSRIVVVIEIIQPHHLMASVESELGRACADKTSGTCD